MSWRMLIEWCVKAGYDQSKIIDRVRKHAEEDGTDFSEGEIRSLIDAQLRLALAEQRSWKRPCDLEKLQTVFDALELKGIICRHDEGPTLTWSRGTIQEEVEILESRGTRIRGHLFYHSQDMDRAVEEGVLLLGFGGPTKSTDRAPHPAQGLARLFQRFTGALSDRAAFFQARELGREIVHELLVNRLPVAWNDDPQRRIRLEDFTWRVPRDETTMESLIHFGPKVVAKTVGTEW